MNTALALHGMTGFQKKLIYLLFFCWLNCMPLSVYSQCTGLDFTIPATACVGQNIKFSANSIYSSYEWDFCAGDLNQTPVASLLTNAFGGASFKVEIEEENGLYYG
ncbi:MAG TPA: hypothetical protein VG737_10100, partial [Cyclobacteriaceae bacterium]|nr:hypothetical protein [Cyclobacteriaceae bacterium]